MIMNLAGAHIHLSQYCLHKNPILFGELYDIVYYSLQASIGFP